MALPPLAQLPGFWHIAFGYCSFALFISTKTTVPFALRSQNGWFAGSLFFFLFLSVDAANNFADTDRFQTAIQEFPRLPTSSLIKPTLFLHSLCDERPLFYQLFSPIQLSTMMRGGTIDQPFSTRNDGTASIFAEQRRWLARLAVRKHPATLTHLPRRVDINSRGALIQVEYIHLILLLLQIAGGTIYETFISVQHEDSPEFIARMAAQEAFSIMVFDGVEVQPVHAFVTPNVL